MITRSKSTINWTSASKRASLYRKKPYEYNLYRISLGISFEENVLKDLRNRSNITIPTVSTTITEESINKTIEYMKQGIPLIHSAPLRDPINKTQGIADLLIRSDSFHRFFPTSPLDRLTRRIPSSLSRSYHYIVVEIKYSTLHLLNENWVDEEKHLSHKAQLEVYNNAITLIQGYKPQLAFILGHRQICSRRITSSYRDRLGKVCMREALRVPTNTEAVISKVWYCTNEHQEILNDHNIQSLTDKRCTAELLGFSGKRGEVINAILKAQRSKHPIQIGNRVGIPTQKSNHYYIDIETLQKGRVKICMIGLYHPVKGYKYFMINSKKPEEEKRILEEFLHELPYDALCFHWGNIEPREIEKALKRYQLHQPNGLKWFDMNIMFKSALIGVKDCFTYKLKDVGRALYRHKLIKTVWDENEDETEIIMNLMNPSYRDKAIDYNRVDCVILHEIMECVGK